MYTKELAKQICDRVAHSSIGLRHICAELGVAYTTVTNWIYDEDHDFHAKYAKAKLMQLDYLAEEVLNIADDSTNDYMTVVKNGKECQVLNREAISRSNLRIRARLMLIAKLSPILHAGKVKPKEKPARKIGYELIPPLAAEALSAKELPLVAEALSAKEAREMPENDYGSSPKSQYEQPGASPANQGQTSQLSDAELKDKRAREAQENIEDPYRSPLSFFRTYLPGSSPKNTLKLAPEGSAPARQGQTSPSPDAVLEDKGAREGKENIEGPQRSSPSFSRTHLPGSSPKNTLSPAIATAKEGSPAIATAKEGKPTSVKHDPIVPGFADFVARGGAPALYKR